MSALMSLLTELWIVWRTGFYKDAAPNGAVICGSRETTMAGTAPGKTFADRTACSCRGTATVAG